MNFVQSVLKRKTSLIRYPLKKVQMSEVWPTRKDSEPRPRKARAGSTSQAKIFFFGHLVLPRIFSPSQISQQKVIVGEDAVVPEDPKHDYLVFAGWYLKEDRKIEVKDFTNIQKDLTVVAEYAKDLNRNGIDDEIIDILPGQILS